MYYKSSFLKYEKIKCKCDIKIIKSKISFIKRELKHNKKLTYQQKQDYVLELKKQTEWLYYKRRFLICL